MSQQHPSSSSSLSRGKGRRLTIAVIVVTLLLVAAAPAVAALALTPWQRNVSFSQGAVGPKGDAGAKGSPGRDETLSKLSTADDALAPYEFGVRSTAGGFFTTGAVPAPAAPSPTPSFRAVTNLEAAQRQIIAQANVSLEVTAVQSAVGQVQAIAQSLGGYVEQLTSSGVEENQYATITLRLPQSEFYNALDRLRALGKVKSESLGSQDVTEQFIDLEARLRSALQEEQSLLALLGRAQQISDVLTIERELARVRSDIERYQGQLNFMKRRVDLATITVSLYPPDAKASQPPAGALTVETKKATASAEAVKALAARLQGEIDTFFISVRDGRSRADISLRVYAKDFSLAVAEMEGEGKVLSKEVREGTQGKSDAKPAERPDAPINIALVEPAPKSGWRQALIVGLWVGSGALAVMAGLAFYGVYRLGRRRGGKAA